MQISPRTADQFKEVQCHSLLRFRLIDRMVGCSRWSSTCPTPPLPSWRFGSRLRETRTGFTSLHLKLRESQQSQTRITFDYASDPGRRHCERPIGLPAHETILRCEHSLRRPRSPEFGCVSPAAISEMAEYLQQLPDEVRTMKRTSGNLRTCQPPLFERAAAELKSA